MLCKDRGLALVPEKREEDDDSDKTDKRGSGSDCDKWNGYGDDDSDMISVTSFKDIYNEWDDGNDVMMLVIMVIPRHTSAISTRRMAKS